MFINRKNNIFIAVCILLAQVSSVRAAGDRFVLGESPFGKNGSPELFGYAPARDYFREKPLYGSPKERQKVLVQHKDAYRFGYIQKADNEKKVASVAVVDRSKAVKQVLPVSFDELYIHPSWLKSYSCFSPVVYTDISFDEWVQMYDILPVYDTKSGIYCPLDPRYFCDVCTRLKKTYEKSEPEGTRISNEDQFYVQKLDLSGQSDLQQASWLKPFSYLQRLLGLSDASVGKKVVVFGDIHADSSSLIKGLVNLKRIGYLRNDFSLAPGVYSVFLGDYVDRGAYDCDQPYGIQVLYTLFRLKQANPKRVFLIRGNHEKVSMNKADDSGFDHELCHKMGYTQSERDTIYRLYDLLPVALYIQSQTEKACQTLLCCHGMPEIGFYARGFLQSCDRVRAVTRINRCAWLMQNAQKIDSDASITPDVLTQYIPKISMMDIQPSLGFYWDDIDTTNPKSLTHNRGRGFQIGVDIVRQLLDREGIGQVVRGHQHSDMAYELHKNKGCAVSCDGRVATLVSGKVVSGFNNYSYAIWQKAGGMWYLQHVAD